MLIRRCSIMLFPGLEILLPSARVVVCRRLMQPTVPFISPPNTASGPPSLPSGHPRRHPYPVQLPRQLTVVQILCAPPPFCIPEHPGLTQVRHPQGGLFRLFACSGGGCLYSCRTGGLCSGGHLFLWRHKRYQQMRHPCPLSVCGLEHICIARPENIGPRHYSNIKTIGR